MRFKLKNSIIFAIIIIINFNAIPFYLHSYSPSLHTHNNSHPDCKYLHNMLTNTNIANYLRINDPFNRKHHYTVFIFIFCYNCQKKRRNIDKFGKFFVCYYSRHTNKNGASTMHVSIVLHGHQIHKWLLAVL